MTFEEAVEMLVDYLEGTLRCGQKRDVEKLLADCPHVLESYQKTTSLCRKTLRHEPSGELFGQVMARLRQERRGPRERS